MNFKKEIEKRTKESVIKEGWKDILNNLDLTKIQEVFPSKIEITDRYTVIREHINDHLPKDLMNIVALYGDELLNRPYIYKNACLAIDNPYHTEIRDYTFKELDILQRHGCNAGVIHPEQSSFEVQHIVSITPCHTRWLVEAFMEIIAMNVCIGKFTPVNIIYFNKCYVPGFFITKLTCYDRELVYLCINLLDPLKGYMKYMEDKIDGLTKKELIRHFRRMSVYSGSLENTAYTMAREDYHEHCDTFHKII